ncbi:maternal embryonic leucine zipper kinase [Trichuris trichiura]|uniref:non-specific serine/threonine protein kinase n=1 Tax=Trichuris trichiura TaxID=36087 RepID=A0A077Z395_TRITR|nr:maternal embryonic leucine zipper kinase [Trichuris trichiura]
MQAPLLSQEYEALNGLYDVFETIGSGGFAKVKRGVHILTGTNVAIKIMKKAYLKHDLPRVYNEINALTHLHHQNICRLYEYCSGGELFDYIVKKDGLLEPEARLFFRQIIAAVTFVHENGFAHRDLKPENLLLTEDLRLKLIDFGLCAKPECGLKSFLKTCCGSPAYAAPELISGKEYCGNEADIWSMGVLLYTLLCGRLPFDDDNVTVIYKKIMAGHYDEPKWLSSSVRSLLRSMLQTDPKKRIKAKDLLVHPWVARDFNFTLKWQSLYQPSIIDRECVMEIAAREFVSVDAIVNKLKEWKYDHLTATYLILLMRKSKGLPIFLPPKLGSPQRLSGKLSHRQQIISSPTIHASLENICDESDDDASAVMDATIESSQIVDKKINDNTYMTCSADDSYHTAIEAGLEETMAANGCDNKVAERQQNINAQVNTKAVLIPRPPPTIYCTPDGKISTFFLWTACQIHSQGSLGGYTFQRKTQVKMGFLKIVRALEREAVATEGTPSRTPRSVKRTPKTARRVFCSVERKLDRMIHLLTPKRKKLASVHTKLAKYKASTNVSVIPHKCPEDVVRTLLNVFQSKGVVCKRKGWTVRGKAKDASGRVYLTVEFEVVRIDSIDMVGVRRKRLNGDSWSYKRICEDVLNLANL